MPDGVGAAVVVGGAHSSWQCATHTAKTAGFFGQLLMQAPSDPPGQSLGLGLGGVGAGAGASVVVVGHSSWHTDTQASYAAPVTTEHAAIQALSDPPGQSPGGGDGGVGDGAGVGDGLGDGVGTGAGQLVSTAFSANCFT